MPTPTSSRPRTIRVRHGRKPAESPSPEPPRQPELSNYELLERRSRQLEEEHAKGGTGTAQAPDAETPLLFSKPAATPPATTSAPRGRSAPGAKGSRTKR
jgi:hypothetical protein